VGRGQDKGRRVKPRTVPDCPSCEVKIEIEPSLNDGVLEEILAIARARAILLDDLKQAVLENDAAKIKSAASRLCGLRCGPPEAS
jgi:hypothetical protein